MKLKNTQVYDSTDGLHKDVYSFTNKKVFRPISTFGNQVVEEVFEFAYGMSFGSIGHHRNHRTGGNNRRRKGEIFADTFQGKLAEFALWELLNCNSIDVVRPDTEMYKQGIWDASDFEYKGIKIAVKSTKSFGQLLLLESADWNHNGLYIPNLGTGNELYHYFVLIRLSTFAADILKENRLYYNDMTNKEELKKLIVGERFSYDIPGYITRQDLIQMIQRNYFIPQGAYLNRISKNTKLDANNYYLQTGNLNDISNLITSLQQV
ncbi:hypothetical protein FORC086_05065 [Bacillus cereus]|uniref:hypothetical protein n=1 Tax=Bacillus cereus TaxID=1396 RepID=UPI0010FBE0A0|nr:hypothetical protein [Bacillus cereus]QCT43468.1 hypothetical protein FORC086_05065 [Bacillus cereus]